MNIKLIKAILFFTILISCNQNNSLTFDETVTNLITLIKSNNTDEVIEKYLNPEEKLKIENVDDLKRDVSKSEKKKKGMLSSLIIVQNSSPLHNTENLKVFDITPNIETNNEKKRYLNFVQIKDVWYICDTTINLALKKQD